MPKYISQTKETYNRNKHSVKSKLNLKNTRIGEHWSSVLDRKLDHLNKSELISLVQSQAIIIAQSRRYNLNSKKYLEAWKESERKVDKLQAERLELLENFYSYMTKEGEKNDNA